MPRPPANVSLGLFPAVVSPTFYRSPPPLAVFSASVRGARIHERGAASQRQARCGTRLFVMDAFSMGEEKSSRQCCSGQHSPLWVWWRESLSASVFTSPQVLSRALGNDSGHPGIRRFYLILFISLCLHWTCDGFTMVGVCTKTSPDSNPGWHVPK